MSKNIIIKKLRDLEGNKKGLWINNLTLKKSLDVGDVVNVIYDVKNRVMIVEKTDLIGSHTVSYRKSKPDVPILDIKNNSLTELFKDVEKVQIEFHENKLIIKVAHIEELKNERENKNSFTTFEFFCSGGTLSEQFKYAGYRPIGGLEIQESALTYFEHNHTSSQLTILSDIKDMVASDYPTNVDTVLCGIPCTNFSKSNKAMLEAYSRYKEGNATQEDMILVEKRNEAEYLTFYLLEGLRAINPRSIVIEEVVEYSTTNAADMLRSILKQMNYEISETISIGSHTKRKRWCLVANAGKKVNLDNLLPQSNKTICEVIGKTVDEIEWKPLEEIQRLKTAASKPSIGVRYALATDTLTNTFTGHSTRSTEPCMKHPTEDLYYEFTNEDIKHIHGLHNYELMDTKKWNRYVLGNGVTDMFYHVANRIKEARESSFELESNSKNILVA